MWYLVPWPGIKPGPPALVAWSLSHWTTREVPIYLFIVGSLWLSFTSFPDCTVLCCTNDESKRDIIGTQYLLSKWIHSVGPGERSWGCLIWLLSMLSPLVNYLMPLKMIKNLRMKHSIGCVCFLIGCYVCKIQKIKNKKMLKCLFSRELKADHLFQINKPILKTTPWWSSYQPTL